jgi:hypothetical protein
MLSTLQLFTAQSLASVRYANLLTSRVCRDGAAVPKSTSAVDL